ncbi:MAG TPA: hypothetical protein VD788_09735 [Candidatus Polarisedimenticolaceae bacterium]|nr:hypothetical protein [Candidatus Polarisedimenticolaceae bacterium]
MPTVPRVPRSALAVLCVAAAISTRAEYVNFESAHVHALDLTPQRTRLLAVNTPGATLEIFAVASDGGLTPLATVPVGLEPVGVVARTDSEAWVVNQLSDTVSVVDLDGAVVVRTLSVGDEPTDVAFAQGRAFVSLAGVDALEVFDLTALTAPPVRVELFGRKPRAMAVSSDGARLYVVPLMSGNRTTVVHAGVILANDANLDPGRLAALGLEDLTCDGAPPAYPSLPDGITRRPDLPPLPGGVAPVGLIVSWNEATDRWQDETGADWSHCLPFRLPDHDLFVVSAGDLSVTTVDRLGTSLFDVSVNPGNGKIYIPHTDARNFVRFEHPQGVQGHVVDNRIAIVDPSDGYSVTLVDLNDHIDRGSDPATNLAERRASISQPGMMAWSADGTRAWLVGLGSRKVFRLDAACETGACIFGADRADPAVVEVGEGPSAVALNEPADRLYVLNRFSNSIAIVDTEALAKVSEIELHDPTPLATLDGRRFLYDAIDGSGHGDNACSSCHLFGDRDDLAWDLGNPGGDSVPYTTIDDNVRFVIPVGGEPLTCDPALCAAQTGFDPQKGPMTTQTLRGMLEPLHWRGDRATMNNFNQAFPGLMGTADIGPINGEPAGLSTEEMERFRRFALAIRYPPNPNRNIDDTLPDADLRLPGSGVDGNPLAGELVFNEQPTDAGQPCVSCHSHPFGAAGGTVGGVEPAEPTSLATAALFNGNADQSFHSDVKVAHLRNMYEKRGPTFGDHVGADPPAKSGVGFGHDGSIPDLLTFFSFNVFTMTAEQVADVAAFSLHFPTGTRPAVGRQLTVPAGSPPTAPPAAESLLATLIGLGDLAGASRHCELVASAEHGGRVRAFHLSGGLWVTDVAAEAPLATGALRQQATSPVTFLCVTPGSGPRLGGDRDQDVVPDGDDCAASDPETWRGPAESAGVTLARGGATTLVWNEQATSSGPSVRYDVLGGSLASLRADGGVGGASCVAGALVAPDYADTRPDPAAGEGLYYLVRGVNDCAVGTAGAGREPLDARICP